MSKYMRRELDFEIKILGMFLVIVIIVLSLHYGGWI